jgi:hypothetical protein
MQLKPITAIAVLLLLVASLSVAGCTTTNNTDTSTTTQHDTLLENYLAAFKTRSLAALGSNYTTKAWEVTWINSTSARLEYTSLQKSSNLTLNLVGVFTVFPMTQEATKYLNALNKTEYSLTDNTCTGTAPAALAYKDAAGHAPQVCKDYEWMKEGTLSSGSDYREYHIYQLDNIILQATLKGWE